MQTNLNKIAIHYEVSGPPDAPWLVLSNSMMTNLHMWDPQMDALSAYRVLRYDQRGHGGTEATEGAYSFGLLAADALALMDHVGAERVHWVGLSMGGMVGQAVVLNHSERIRSLTLCDTRGHSPKARKEQRIRRIERVERDGIAPMVERCIQGQFSESFAAAHPPLMDTMREMIRGTSVAGVVGNSHALCAHNYSPRLHEITVPTLIILGEKDESTPVSESQDMRDRIPGARMVVLSEAKHLANIERATEFNAELLSFLHAVETP